MDKQPNVLDINDINGRQDWLDIFPDYTFVIVGNMETVSYPGHEHSEPYINPDDHHVKEAFDKGDKQKRARWLYND